jgi:putative copper resistance protein D
MADDWINIALRFGQYIDLTALLGVAIFGVYALGLNQRAAPIVQRFSVAMVVAGCGGIALSVAAMAFMAKAMVGAESYSEMTAHMYSMVITGTSMGVAWIVRVVALVACVGLAASRIELKARFIGLSAICSVAAATLAWAGHAAMNDGLRGLVHLASDITHLWAAGAWIGALFAFVMLAVTPTEVSPHAAEVLSQTSAGFAKLGTVIVGTLVVTGSLNYLMIVGPSIEGVLTSPYGVLLATKLTLFAGMLALAAVNRFKLSPRLEAAASIGDHAIAVKLLRKSLLSETGLAILVVACVAWLGVLSPR